MTSEQHRTVLVVQEVHSLLARARKWPGFESVERHVTRLLETHQQFRRGPIDTLRLFKAYKLAMRQVKHQ